jgi:hypothetical protein
LPPPAVLVGFLLWRNWLRRSEKLLYTGCTLMRIPMVERFRFKHAVLYAVLLFLVQQMERTDLAYSALCAAYILIACIAFNAAGGLVHPSGCWIFSNALFVVLIGITYKAFLGEAGQTDLRDPVTTMGVQCGAMVSFAIAAAVVRRVLPERGLLKRIEHGDGMKRGAIGAFLLGATVQIFSMGSPDERGTVATALRQINHFVEMSIMLATFYEVKKSHGARSSNWILWVAVVWSSFFGFIGFSKQGILVPPAAWLITAIVTGHDFSRKKILAIVLAALFFQAYLVPFSQLGRNARSDDDTVAQSAKIAWQYLTNLGQTREFFRDVERQNAIERSDGPHLYDQPQGFFDRLSMLPPDDALIGYTDEGNIEGLAPTGEAFLNIIPHFIWKDKPYYFIGNSYAREMGYLSDRDETTGISFSPASDAYHQARWYGVFLLLPAILLLNFSVTNLLSGDIRKAPWGILFVVVSAHTSPEGGVFGQVYDASYTAFGVVLIALISLYVLPVMTGVLTNSDRTRVRKTGDFRSVPRPSARISARPSSRPEQV